jgi:undecaprenyl diphosphate synthase
MKSMQPEISLVTKTPPGRGELPRHVAIVMDGNGRWAKLRKMPRIYGHRSGVQSVREIVEACLNKGIGVLTLFAFSSENWKRPTNEVSLLMELFISSLKSEVQSLHKNGVRLAFVGDRAPFSPQLREQMQNAEQLTSANTRLALIIAANYGGRWDINQATRQVCEDVQQGKLAVDDITPDVLQSKMALAGLPEPDLFIRTGGEKRISNFLLWQLAYTELYFTEILWPDFDRKAFDNALNEYTGRQRRFGLTGEQVEQARGA